MDKVHKFLEIVPLGLFYRRHGVNPHKVSEPIEDFCTGGIPKGAPRMNRVKNSHGPNKPLPKIISVIHACPFGRRYAPDLMDGFNI